MFEQPSRGIQEGYCGGTCHPREVNGSVSWDLDWHLRPSSNPLIDYRTRRLIQSSNIKSFDGKIPATAHCSSILGTHAYGCMELHLPFTTRLTISVNRNERAKNVIQKLIALYNIINLNLKFAEYFFYTSKM